MAQSVSVGHVMNDIELKESAKKNPYVRFVLKEWIGYGKYRRPQYIDVWAWGGLALKLKEQGVKQGSLLSVSGSLELEEFVRRDGRTRDKRLKLGLKEWSFIHEGEGNLGCKGKSQKKSRPIEVIDGERESLPE